MTPLLHFAIWLFGSTASLLTQEDRLGRHNSSLFIFGAADGRPVLRDIFLDGNTPRVSRSVSKKTEPQISTRDSMSVSVLGRIHSARCVECVNSGHKPSPSPWFRHHIPCLLTTKIRFFKIRTYPCKSWLPIPKK